MRLRTVFSRQCITKSYLSWSRSGLAFFGTPHNGANQTLVTLGSAAARVATALYLQPNSDIGEALQNGSLYTDILKDYWRDRLLDYDLISFWEGIGDVSLRPKMALLKPGSCIVLKRFMLIMS